MKNVPIGSILSSRISNTSSRYVCCLKLLILKKHKIQVIVSGFLKRLSAFSRFPMEWVCPTVFPSVRRIIRFYPLMWQLIFMKYYRNLIFETYIPSQIWPKLASSVTTIEGQGERQRDPIYFSQKSKQKIQQLIYEH